MLYTYLLQAVIALAIFYFGIMIGIKDCKNRFGIPAHVTGVDEDGYYCD